MKNTIVFLTLMSFLLAGSPVGATVGSEGEHAISKVKLTPESLPPGMRIAQEIWASTRQVLTVRMRVGFPIQALFNQTMLYENEQAKVNYMVASNEDWVNFGYSKLVETDGTRSFIFLKDNVIVQIAATTREFGDVVAHLFKADPLHYRKIRVDRLPKGWTLMNEGFLSREEAQEYERELGVQLESALVQEFITNRLKIRVRYYNCGTLRAAEDVVRYIAGKRRPLLKRTVESQGAVVVVAESQDEDLNDRAMSLVNWRPRVGADVAPR